MRVDVVAENPLESIGKALDLLPASVVRVVWGFTVARTLVAAVELGVFEALKDGPRTASELATTLACDPEGMRTLLVALNGFGLLRRRKDTFTLKGDAPRYLTSKHGSDMTDAVRMGVVLDRKMQNLAHAIRTGEREDFHAHLEGDEWQSYLGGLASLAGITTKEIVGKLKLARPPARLLDVGGGHARFSVAMCRRYPELRATILDLPGGAAVGERLVAKDPERDRVSFVAGDLRTTPWGSGFDVAFLFNILHNLAERDAARAVEQAFDALAPGGTLAILEGQHAGGDGDLSFQEGFGELFFYVLSNSLTWPAPTLVEWMKRAGFARVVKRKVLTLPGAVLLVGTKG